MAAHGPNLDGHLPLFFNEDIIHIKSAPLKYAVHWILVYSQICTTITTVLTLKHFHHPNKKPLIRLISSHSSFPFPFMEKIP